MYAVIVTGGKQYKVSEGDVIYVEKLGVEDGASVSFDAIFVGDGEKTYTGAEASAFKVTGKVQKNGKQKKVLVFKFKAKKNYRRRQGHRQPYSKVVIETIA